MGQQRLGSDPDVGHDSRVAHLDQAMVVWNTGNIAAAPFADNVLMDRSAAAWKAKLSDLKAEVGECTTDAPIVPVSAMEGRFVSTCEHGEVAGRVQRAPTKTFALQALEFAPQTP